MKKKKLRLRYKKQRVVLSDVLPYELPITFTNRYFYRFLVKNGVKYSINPLDLSQCQLSWNAEISVGAKQILDLLFSPKNGSVISCEKNCITIKSEHNIPFTYRIQHKRGKFRELAVIHPADQIKMVSFYDKYKSLMLYYCQQSRFSLRHPHAVACYFFYRDRLHRTLLGKRSDDVELFFNEYENLKTFFSYKQFTQIYRFYDDYRYQRAEKKFANLQKFDVQSCFNSIYSHSIAWATNGGKEIYKQSFIPNDGSFGLVWDNFMQKMNYNETNGIVIGPEFSRIFAEVIFQYVDSCVERDLLNKGYRWNVDYECYRYVDDYFFFYNDDQVLAAANESFACHLNEYKMSISKEKTEHFSRPFITPISRAKLAIDQLIKDQVKITFEKDDINSEEDDEAKDIDEKLEKESETMHLLSLTKERVEKAVNRKYSLYFRSAFFNSSFQSILKTYGVEAKDVLNYTLARMSTKVERTLKKYDSIYRELSLVSKVKGVSPEVIRDATKKRDKMEYELSRFLLSLLDSSFFIYSFNRQLNATLKLISLLNSIIIYLNNDYHEKYADSDLKNADVIIKRFSEDTRAIVFKKIQDEISVVFQCSHYLPETQLETLYFLITLRSMRSKYHLPAAAIEDYLNVKIDGAGKKVFPPMNALTITLFLYYFGNSKKYQELQKYIIDKACTLISSTRVAYRKRTAEVVMLLLDLLSCPYISKEAKLQVGKSFGLSFKATKNIIKYFKPGRYMFTNWKRLNITKELNAKISQEVYA